MTGPLVLFGVVAVALFAGAADALPPKKIVGGTKAAPGEFPYMVSLRCGGNHFCGGTIVSPRHIVTAAHCFTGISPNTYSNCHVATGSILNRGGTAHAFSNVTIHPNFDENSAEWDHDIAIILLAEDIVFDEDQSSLDLPTERVPQVALANVTGWGYDTWDRQQKSITQELMKINVVIISAELCHGYLGGTMHVKKSHLCTLAGRGVGVCLYDSGGPLAYNGQLVGIVSRGQYCALGIPDVYTSVYHHVNWIKQTMEEQDNSQGRIQ